MSDLLLDTSLPRRSWLARLAALALLPRPLRIRAQTAAFPAADGAVLAALAATVLPASLGAARVRDETERFIRWVREYRAGAEMEHGYGFTRLRKKGESPAAAYQAQLRSLAEQGFAAAPLDRRRAQVEQALAAAQVQSLPGSPNGGHVAADLMSFYFSSSRAADFCYGRAIRRDECIGFAGAGQPPAPVKERGA